MIARMIPPDFNSLEHPYGTQLDRHEFCKENFARHLLSLVVILRHLAIFFLSADIERCTSFGPNAKASAHNEQSPFLKFDVDSELGDADDPSSLSARVP